MYSQKVTPLVERQAAIREVVSSTPAGFTFNHVALIITSADG